MIQSASDVLAATKEEGEVKPVESSLDWKGRYSCGSETGSVDQGLENKEKVTKEGCKKAKTIPEKELQSASSALATLDVHLTKKRKSTKKQLLLAQAAKNESQNIFKFFSIHKTESKALAPAPGLEEEGNCYLGEQSQFPSEREHEKKAVAQETEDDSKEEIASSFLVEEQEWEKTEAMMRSSGSESPCLGLHVCSNSR